MKHSKWLLVTVSILLIINILFFTVWYVFNVQGMLSAKLEKYLSKELNGTFSIKKLSINDRHITANSIVFKDFAGNINLNIKQIQVRYNLFKILLSGFKIDNAISQIDVYEPKVKLTYHLVENDNKPFKIPDIAGYFKVLEVKNGSFDFTFSMNIDEKTKTDLRIFEKFKHINLIVKNNKASEITLKASTGKGGTIDLKSTLLSGLITKVKLQITQFKPTSVQIDGFENLNSDISLLANYTQPDIQTEASYTINSIIWNTAFSYDKYHVTIPYLHLDGNQNKLSYDFREGRINDNYLSSKGNVFNLLMQPSVDGTADIIKLNLSGITKELTGVAEGQIAFSGGLDDFKASGNVTIPAVTYQNETITDIVITADYSGDSLNFRTQDFHWNKQSGILNGYYNISKNELGINLTTEPNDINQEFQLESDISGLIKIGEKDIAAEVIVNNLNIYSQYATLEGLHGKADFAGDIDFIKHSDLDVILTDTRGMSLAVNGDIIAMDLKAILLLDSISTYEYSPFLKSEKINSTISGKINAALNKSIVSGNCLLALDMITPKVLTTDINTDFSYNIENNIGNLSFNTDKGFINKKPFTLSFASSINSDILRLTNINIDNDISANGWINTLKTAEFGFQAKADSIDFSKYWYLINTQDNDPPLSSIIDFDLDYNFKNNHAVKGSIYAESTSLLPIKPFTTIIDISGTTDKAFINADVVTSNSNKLSIQSSVSLFPELNLLVDGQFNKFKLEDVLSDGNLKGLLDGTVRWKYKSSRENKPESSFLVVMNGQNISYDDFVVDSLQVNINQTNDILKIDKLHAVVGNYFTLSGKGALDYNIITNSYATGNNSLNLSFEGDILKWLNHKEKYIEDAKGTLKGQMLVKAGDDGLVIEDGLLSMNRGFIKLKGQNERFSNIDIQARILQNELKLDKFSCKIGNGKLNIRNSIDASGDNFHIGPLNLGYFLVRTDDNGIDINMPDYMPANTTANAIIKGRNSKEATIKGPFDDMEIKGEILCSNGNALYPASTSNLMQLMNFFRTKSKNDNEIPLPFTLDLMIIVKENVNYVTYPANLKCLPESFLHLTYDGKMWNAAEADFQSEQGTLDFYGSIFDVEFVKLIINQQQQIIALNGTFTRKAPDGTLVTLTVSTNLQKEGDLFNQLEFTLSSDNPEDKNAPQILSRLRYNRSIDELSPEQRQTLLQDEAMQVIGTSVSTTYISQWLSPVENSIRKFLKLDSFSIRTGFIQNLYVQYGTDNQDRVLFSDADNIDSDIMQFSSAVLLNNLSLSMGKYMGKSVFLDYQIQLQEATDLAKKTKLVLSHNTSVRYSLPWKLKLSYTYSIKPMNEPNSHEIMIQRNFRF